MNYSYRGYRCVSEVCFPTPAAAPSPQKKHAKTSLSLSLSLSAPHSALKVTDLESVPLGPEKTARSAKQSSLPKVCTPRGGDLGDLRCAISSPNSSVDVFSSNANAPNYAFRTNSA